jgi:hypothetical protein
MCHDIRGGKQFEGRSEQLLVYVVHGEHAGKIHNLWEIAWLEAANGPIAMVWPWAKNQRMENPNRLKEPGD